MLDGCAVLSYRLHSIILLRSGTGSSAAAGTEEENIPDRSKGKNPASCMMGLEELGEGEWRGVKGRDAG